MKGLLFYQLKICLITNSINQSLSNYIAFIEQAIPSVITILQLREKYSYYSKIKKRILELQNLLKPYDIPLITNDFAVKISADGLYLINSDISNLKAQEKLKLNKIIVLSIESLEDLDKANNLSVSYVTASSVFSTSIKLKMHPIHIKQKGVY